MGKFLNRNLLLRTISSLVILFVVVTASLFSPYTMLTLLVIIGIGSMLEFYKVARQTGAKPLDTLATFTGSLLIIMAFFIKIQKIPESYLAFLLPLVAAIFIVELYRKDDSPFVNIGWALTGMAYIAVPLALFAYMPVQPATSGYIVYRPLMILNVFFIVWANDIGAYLVGSLFGKHKLSERLSPRKTWEGFAGGLLLALGVGIVMCNLQSTSFAVWGVASIVIALSSVAGDLVESMLKRSADVKDSGQVIPGHGGFLDRFDALFMSVPFVFTYLLIFT